MTADIRMAGRSIGAGKPSEMAEWGGNCVMKMKRLCFLLLMLLTLVACHQRPDRNALTEAQYSDTGIVLNGEKYIWHGATFFDMGAPVAYLESVELMTDISEVKGLPAGDWILAREDSIMPVFELYSRNGITDISWSYAKEFGQTDGRSVVFDGRVYELYVVAPEGFEVEGSIGVTESSGQTVYRLKEQPSERWIALKGETDYHLYREENVSVVPYAFVEYTTFGRAAK